MAFINRRTPKDRIGEWTVTKTAHSNYFGTMEIGTKVQIMDVTEKGYSIQDEDGNLITGIGWKL